MSNKIPSKKTKSSSNPDDVIDLFLCHNSCDKDWVRDLAERIESETIDGTELGRPLRVFFDEWDINIGENIILRINEGLQSAEFVAAIISPEFLKAPWANFEWSHITSNDPMNIKNRLVPIYLQDITKDGLQISELPAPFSSLNWIDFRQKENFRDSYRRLVNHLRNLPPDRGKTRPSLAGLSSTFKDKKKLKENESTRLTRNFKIRGTAPALRRQLIGRESDIKAIRHLLEKAQSEETAGIVVIRGAAGIGKTALLNYFAQDQSLTELFPSGGLWADVGEAPDINQILLSWAQAVKLPSGQQIRINDIVAALRAKLQGQRMLLLVDDVWKDTHAESLRIASGGSAVLYSTRLRDLALQLAQSSKNVYNLEGLKSKDGIALLADVAPDAVQEHPQLCEEFIKDVDGHPLAILVAGRMLNREVASGGDIASILNAIKNDARLLLGEDVPPDMIDLLNQTTPDVAAVLKRSIDVLDEIHKKYFARLAGFAPSPAPFDIPLAATFWKVDEKKARSILKYFVEQGLVELPKRGLYQIHPLMKALALREWILLDE